MSPTAETTIRETILKAPDRAPVPVKVPEWGLTVHVRALSGKQRDAFEASLRRDPNSNLRARLIAATACDAEGVLLFTEADADALGDKGVSALQLLFDAAIEANRFSKADVDELERP